MASLYDFAEWFMSRGARIVEWYADDVGKWAFRTRVDGVDLVCAVRNSGVGDGTTSVMRRVCGRAQVNDGLVCIQTEDGRFVVDPVTVLSTGNADGTYEKKREDRGEEWVRFDLDNAVGFREWYAGEEPPKATTLDSY